MAKKEEELRQYIIPVNVTSKTIFGGMLKLRNFIEGVIMLIVLGILAIKITGMLNMSIAWRFFFIGFVVVGSMLLAVVGIKGDSFTEFLLKIIHYDRMKKIYDIPTEEELAERELRLIKEDKELSEKEKKAKKEKEKLQKQLGSDEETKKTNRELKKQLKKEKKRKAEEERIKENMIANGMDPVKVAALDVFEDKRKEEANRTKPKKKQDNIIIQRIKELQDMGEMYRENYSVDSIQFPPVTTTAVDFLPYETLQGGVLKTKDKRYVKFVEIVPTNFHLRENAEKNAIIANFFAYLRITPVKFQIKCISRKTDSKGRIKKNKEYMEMETNAKCIEMQQDFIQLLSYISENASVQRKFYIIFSYETLSTGLEEDVKAINILNSICERSDVFLKHCDLSIASYEEENDSTFIAKTLYEFLNRNESMTKDIDHRRLEVAKYYMKTLDDTDDLNKIPMSELFAPKRIDFEESPQYAVIDGRYYRYFYIPGDGFKSIVHPGWSSTLIDFDEGVDVDFFFERQDRKTMKRKITYTTRFKMAGMLNSNEANTDFDESMDRLQSSRYIKQGLADEEDFYYMSCLITVSADTYEELESKTTRLMDVCMTRDMELKDCNYIQDKAFLSSLPLCKLDPMIRNSARRNVLSSGVAATFPFISNELTDEDGIMIGVDQVSNAMAILDLFNTKKYKNANMLIFGTPGAGKTYLLSLMALRLRRMRIPIYIVAPLKSFEFRRSCNEIGGQFISISPSSNQCINVMEIRKRDDSIDKLIDGYDETEEVSELTSKIESIMVFFSLIKPDITHKEKNILDRVLMRTYAKKGITKDNDSLYIEGTDQLKEMPVLGDLYATLKKEEPERGEDMLEALEKFVHGSAKNFNQQTNVDLDNMYTVFDVENLGKDVLPAGMFIAIDFIWSKIKEDRSQKKAIFMDELWKLIGDNPIAAEYVLEIFKIIRSYGGAAVAATQSSNDMKKLDDGKYGKEIVNCSAIKFILKLEKDEAVNIQSYLDLSESEINSVKNFEAGNCLAMCREGNLPIRIVSSPKEHELITTKRADIEKMVNAKRKALEKQ